jgi:hypothetical protein
VGQSCQRVNARAWARVRMGRVAGPRRSERERTGRPCGWAEPVEGRGGGPKRKFLFFFFKNVNSNSICLFY